MYFKQFPDLYYEFEFPDGRAMKIVKDITFNMRPLKAIIENVVYYSDYFIQDEDTPEIVAERLYGNPELHWVIMLVNEKYHYLNDWPVSDSKFSDYVEKKYGVGNSNAIHILYGRPHYVNENGKVVDANYPLATPVTNEEYERRLNDAKRNIKIVSPNLIDIFIRDLQEASK